MGLLTSTHFSLLDHPQLCLLWISECFLILLRVMLSSKIPCKFFIWYVRGCTWNIAITIIWTYNFGKCEAWNDAITFSSHDYVIIAFTKSESARTINFGFWNHKVRSNQLRLFDNCNTLIHLHIGIYELSVVFSWGNEKSCHR